MIFLEDDMLPTGLPSLPQEQDGTSDHAPVLISFLSYKALIFEERFIYIFQRRQLTSGFQLHCTPIQCRILVAFLQHPEQELSFCFLASVAFRIDASLCDPRDIVALQKHVSKLKHKLPPFLELVAVKGHGYVLRPHENDQSAGGKPLSG